MEAEKSEIRGVFIHSSVWAGGDPDPSLIAQTCHDYGVDMLIVEVSDADHIIGERINQFVTTCHSLGMKLFASHNLLLTPENTGLYCVDYNGNPFPWACPSKQATISATQNIIAQLLTYDIDGFAFDYARYAQTGGICYCSECKAKFEAYLGETITNWPGDFAPGGSRNNERMEWRVKLVNDLVTMVRNQLLAAKPSLVIGAVPWPLFANNPIYQRYWIGQDTANWIGKDQLDFVSPQIYTTSLTDVADQFNTSVKYWVGGPEGKIPLVPVLADINADPEGGPTPVDTFVAEVNLIRSLGADGWIIWKYGGPGDAPGNNAPDIRPYLAALNMPNVFSLSNIQVSPSGTGATITWTTELSATSKVEYSTSPLFVANFKSYFNEYTGFPFHYWEIDRVLGIIVEDNTPVTNHSITITGLSPGTKYYFRVQSQDPSGIATSKVLTFTTQMLKPHTLNVKSTPILGVPFNIRRI